MGTTTYIAAHHQILAHAAVCRMYREKFQAEQAGECGITLNMNWAEPKDPTSSVDRAAAERGSDFMIGWFAQPIFGDGAYPASMRQRVEAAVIKKAERQKAESLAAQNSVSQPSQPSIKLKMDFSNFK